MLLSRRRLTRSIEWRCVLMPHKPFQLPPGGSKQRLGYVPATVPSVLPATESVRRCGILC